MRKREIKKLGQDRLSARELCYNWKKPPQRLPIFYTMTTLDKEIRTRVAPEIKNAFRDMAKEKGLTESEFLRSIVLNAINYPSNTPTLETTKSNIEITDLKIRLPRFLIEAAKEKASTQGMATSRWIKSLVQSNLIQSPVLTDSAIDAIRESNREIAAVGNNINQISRKFNESVFNADMVTIKKLEEIDFAIDSLRLELKNLVKVSRDGWGL